MRKKPPEQTPHPCPTRLRAGHSGLIEVGHVANKKRIQGILSLDEAVQLTRLAHHMPIRYFSHLDLLEPSLILAAENELTVYDALYLALARQTSACLFTADEALRAAAESLGLNP